MRGRLCALPLEVAIEVMRPLPVEVMAGAPSFVLGLAIIRGRPLPVVDLGRLLGDLDTKPARFVTIAVEERSVTLAVDEVIGVRSIAAESMLELPPLLREASGEVVAAIGSLDAELLLVLRAARVVPEEAFAPRHPQRGSP